MDSCRSWFYLQSRPQFVPSSAISVLDRLVWHFDSIYSFITNCFLPYITILKIISCLNYYFTRTNYIILKDFLGTRLPVVVKSLLTRGPSEMRGVSRAAVYIQHSTSRSAVHLAPSLARKYNFSIRISQSRYVTYLFGSFFILLISTSV